MKYSNITRGIFIERPNRFIAQVNIDGEIHTVHVKNTGRCKELLVPGGTVYLECNDNPKRKTRYTLVAVEKELGNGGNILINMDSYAPNIVAGEWLTTHDSLFGGRGQIKREVCFNESRFDFSVFVDVCFLSIINNVNESKLV